MLRLEASIPTVVGWSVGRLVFRFFFKKFAPLRRGYTHDHMLGMDQKSNPAWVDELKKIRTLKPMRINELIGRFDRRPSAPANEVVTSEEMAFLKQKRRGSLQIHLDPSDMGKFKIW